MNSLARGHTIKSPVVIVGGPLYYYHSLRYSLLKVLSLTEDALILPDMSKVYPAYGAALALTENISKASRLEKFSQNFLNKGFNIAITAEHAKLFTNEQERLIWDQEKKEYKTPQISLQTFYGKDVFIGIDAGSTTTKVVAIDE